MGEALSVDDTAVVVSNRKLVASVEAALPLAEDPLAEELGHGGYLTPSDSKPQKRQCCPCSPAWVGCRCRLRFESGSGSGSGWGSGSRGFRGSRG